jgi:hypothetical protein
MAINMKKKKKKGRRRRRRRRRKKRRARLTPRSRDEAGGREGERRTVLGTMRAAPILFSEIPISRRFSGGKEGGR